MIRINGHLGKLNFKVFEDFQLFSTYQDSIDISKVVCPHCGAIGNFASCPSYKRYLITIEHDKRVDYTIDIHRILCNSCGSSHALLPDILIPYGSYSIRFILYVLNGYLNRTMSVLDFCESLNISVSTLYTWIHKFMNHYELFFGILNRLQWLSLNALHKISSFPFLTQKFFEQFRFSFMQLCLTSKSHNFISDS